MLMDKTILSQDFPAKRNAVEELSAKTTPLPPWLFQHDDLLKSLECAKRLEQKSIINSINYVNFTNGCVFVLLNHHIYKEAILLKAIPDPCKGNEAKFCWMEDNSARLKLNDFIFHYIIIIDGQSIILIPAKLIHIDDGGFRVQLGDLGFAVGRRQAKRYECNDVRVDLKQSGFVSAGELIDFNPLGFRIRIHSDPMGSYNWFNPDRQITADIYQNEKIIFSGPCLIIRQKNGMGPREIVLSGADDAINRFRKKPIRNPRRQITPPPTIAFDHPFFKNTIQREVHDIANLGLSVIETAHDGVLMVGMIIPELTISFQGVSKSTIKCMGQVVYRQSDPEKGILCGIAILDMNIENHSHLTHIISVLSEPHSRLSQEVDTEELWKLFFDTGFMYPEKYQHIHSNRQELKDVYKKLYQNNPDIAKHFTYEKNGQILAHIAMLKAYTKTWVMHHHAARITENNYTGLRVLRQLVHYLNGLSRLPSAKTDFALGYYRPQNEFPDLVFGDFARELNDLNGCSLDLFSYTTFSTDEIGVPLSHGWSLSECSPSDIWELERFYHHRSGGLLLDAMGLKKCIMVDADLESRYMQLGLFRKCNSYSLTFHGELNAVIIVDQSSPGLNLSDLLNGIKVIVTKPDYLGWHILYAAVSRLVKVYSSPEIPLLIFPSEYVKMQNISYEKDYQMCIINLRDNENDYTEYLSRRFRLRLK